jgi:hypothetical protein
MSTSPLRETSAVFDESVLKVEFLQLPAQIPDFSLNLNTEALLYRFGLFMKNIIGPARISGFNVHDGDATHIQVDAGLYLYSNHIVRLNSPVLIDGSGFNNGVVYVHIAIAKMTGDTNPDIVNINPPLSPSSLEGPAQYRYTSSICVGAMVPVDTATDVYFQIATYLYTHPGFSISGQRSVITALGGFDLSTFQLKEVGKDLSTNDYTTAEKNLVATIPNKANSSDVTTQITNAVNGIVNAAPSQLDTIKELADALGDDANYAATVTAALGARPLTTAISGMVRSAVLTGVSFVSSNVITAADSVLSAFGKLQAQINTLTTAILNTVLTGVSFTTSASIVATDSIVLAFGKLQAQINSIFSALSALSTTSNVTFNSVSAKNIVQVLFDSTQTAGTNLGNVAPAISEWQAQDNTEEQKVRGKFVYKAGMNSIVAYLKCRVSTAGWSAYPQLWTDGSGNYETVDTPPEGSPGVISSTYVDVVITTDLSGLTPNTVHDWSVSLHTNGGMTGYMKDLVVTLES